MRFYRVLATSYCRTLAEIVAFRVVRHGMGAQLNMPEAAKGKKHQAGNVAPVDVVITICSHRKTRRPMRSSTPLTIPRGDQNAVAKAWLAKMREVPSLTQAIDFYAGRAFGLAAETATLAGARMYVLSGGLGIVPSSRPIPVYGLTVSANQAQSIATRVMGDFDPAAWFSSLLQGAHSDTWKDVAGRKSGRILVALSRSYAEMAGPSLASAPPRMLERLRIFGAALENVLPQTLHQAIAPYDERLNAIFPGTRSDFAQRAMLHFARSVAEKASSSRGDDFALVNAALKNLKLPRQVVRPRLTDKEILAIIRKRLRMQSGAAFKLSALRHEEGIACEQSRFGRLYRIASGKGGA